MFKGLNREIEQLAKDKGIDKNLIIEAVQSAFLTAAKKKFGAEKDIEAHFNEQEEEIELFEFKNVVEHVEDENNEITFAEAKLHDPECELGDSIGLKMNSEELGRIAAQTAKQVIIQKIRDAETDIIYEEYKDRVGSLITGIVRRFERGNIIIDLGRAEALLPQSQQVPKEIFRPGDRIQGYVMDIRKTPRGTEIIISRAHEGLLIKLFENEVPEIYEGIVSIKSAAREPGVRGKIAVYSKDSDVDPVGACVGMKGSRVQAVVQELRGEKIDIVAYNVDMAQFICNAIAPAEVSRVVLDEANKRLDLVVADDQLSLAIGKKGQNVRLATKLTGWHVDIHSETKMKEMADQDKNRLSSIEGISETMSELLYGQGVTTPEALVENESEKIATATGLDVNKVEALQESAKEWLASEESQSVSQAQSDENLQDQSEIVEQETELEDDQEPVLDQA
ncbi:MAG TPA: transcription termination factor NusA [Oligoflexia bacterium]|nr:transcription termination factor NusA [Oligoflexia bacterium]HMR25128.1 transcription termination factor NusA [Oligoflexia bacterium]